MPLMQVLYKPDDQIYFCHITQYIKTTEIEAEIEEREVIIECIENDETIKALMDLDLPTDAAVTKNRLELDESDMISIFHLRNIIAHFLQTHSKHKELNSQLLNKWECNLPFLYLSLMDAYNKEGIDQNSIQRLDNNYKIKQFLHRTVDGNMSIAERRCDKQIFALRTIHKSWLNEWDLNAVCSEISILRDLDHPNLCKLYDVYENENRYGVILELLTGGELFDVIVEKRCFNESEAAQCFVQLCSALQYIHSKNIVHRDIEPGNLMLSKHVSDWSLLDNDCIKLIGFDAAIKLNTSDGDAEKRLKEYVGSPEYMAPEVHQMYLDSEAAMTYSAKSDMYAAGAVLYTLLVGYPPFTFTDCHTLTLMRKSEIKDTACFHAESWKVLSADAKDLIVGLLHKEPEKRYSAVECLNHNWMKSASTELIDERRMDRLKRFEYIRRMKRGINMILAVLRLIEVLMIESEKKQKC